MESLITSYSERVSDIRKVRDAVFLLEQGVPRSEELDDRDAVCQHALVYQSGRPIATGRIDLEKAGKIGRVAVLAERRRCGAGTEIMRLLEQVAREAALPQVWFHAQLSAVPFYEVLGYHATGAVFVEAGIEHVRMQKTLETCSS